MTHPQLHGNENKQCVNACADGQSMNYANAKDFLLVSDQTDFVTDWLLFLFIYIKPGNGSQAGESLTATKESNMHIRLACTLVHHPDWFPEPDHDVRLLIWCGGISCKLRLMQLNVGPHL